MISQTAGQSSTEMESGSEAVGVSVDKKYKASKREGPLSLVYKRFLFPIFLIN